VRPRRKLGACSRLRALWRVFVVARRAGSLDEDGRLGELTAAALRRARALAHELACLPLDVETATLAGLAVGRRAELAGLGLLDVEVPPPVAHNLPTPEQTCSVDDGADAARRCPC